MSLMELKIQIEEKFDHNIYNFYGKNSSKYGGY